MDHKCKANEPKVCTKCGVEKPSSEFYWKRIKKHRKNGKIVSYQVKFAQCRKCHNRQKTQTHMHNRPSFLCTSYKDSDRKFHRENNLTRALVAEYIAQPCFYCGANDISMGLDRIDNSKGHIVGNVNPCCIRCNSIRRDMPHEAWIMMVPGVKQAYETKKFGNWIGNNIFKGKYPIR